MVEKLSFTYEAFFCWSMSRSKLHACRMVCLRLEVYEWHIRKHGDPEYCSLRCGGLFIRFTVHAWVCHAALLWHVVWKLFMHLRFLFEYGQEQTDLTLKIKHPRRYSEANIWLKNLKSTVRLSVAVEGALLLISSMLVMPVTLAKEEHPCFRSSWYRCRETAVGSETD